MIVSLKRTTDQGSKKKECGEDFNQWSCDGAKIAEYAPMTIAKIISGGQTGADRGGLDAAICHNFPHGGWCPKGRRAEDGPIGGQYQLTESPSANYLQRTEWNVRDTDGTIVFTLAAKITGGSMRTVEFAKRHKKPCLHIWRGQYQPEILIQTFVNGHDIKLLNIAGSRESKEPGIQEWVKGILDRAFFWSESHPNMLGGPGEG